MQKAKITELKKDYLKMSEPVMQCIYNSPEFGNPEGWIISLQDLENPENEILVANNNEDITVYPTERSVLTDCYNQQITQVNFHLPI